MTSQPKQDPEAPALRDPRAVRSREKLAAAILDLAGEHDAGALAAGQVAAAAGVNRSTFYQHAASPAALLRKVLSDELDVLRTEHLSAAGGDIGPAIGAVTAGVVRHLDRHRAIYRRGLVTEPGTGGLHAMLGAHFEVSVRQLLERRAIAVPAPDGREVPPPMVARFIAYGVVGALESRLVEASPRPVDEFLADLRELLPEWWPIG
ncbi:TetR family transcriptional regulator [Pseudarthrobacter chlorophenolicus]|uniref:TetR family transcriptional regulator n=1 Tax=Pseudarthrobacter chlorophenolicus TaxID=85085 RepID=UPI0005F29737|nr:TetR family transcriptional regulator [Pseudarthrobacter chlorophenolicus]